MEEKRIYLIAQFDENTNQRLTAIYDKLLEEGLKGEQTLGIPYHFTLGSFPLDHRDKVLKDTKELCMKTKAFDISLSHIGLFGQRVLFIAPSMNLELLTLYNNAIPGESINGCHNWVAHATVLIDTPDNIAKAIPIVAKLFSPICAKVKSIGIYEFFPKKFLAEYSLLQ